MDIIKMYHRAHKWGLNHHSAAHPQHHRSFAAAVAQLCCDDPKEPLNKRETLLLELLQISGGPTCREGAAIWAAYGKGDSVKSKHEGMTIFYVDPKVKRPGTWTFDEAVEHCEPYCYGELTKLHLEVSRTDPCFDDPPEDLLSLKKLLSS
jgi:hypothetical protein